MGATDHHCRTVPSGRRIGHAASGKSYAVRSVRGPTSFHRTVSMVLPSFGASGQRCPPRMFTGESPGPILCSTAGSSEPRTTLRRVLRPVEWALFESLRCVAARRKNAINAREAPVLALALLPTEFTASQFQRRASHRVAAEIALTDKTAAAVEASEQPR